MTFLSGTQGYDPSHQAVSACRLNGAMLLVKGLLFIEHLLGPSYCVLIDRDSLRILQRRNFAFSSAKDETAVQKNSVG